MVLAFHPLSGVYPALSCACLTGESVHTLQSREPQLSGERGVSTSGWQNREGYGFACRQTSLFYWLTSPHSIQAGKSHLSPVLSRF